MIESMHQTGVYEPDLVFPPGDTLKEALEERGMTQAELAERMGRPKKTLSEIVNGKAQLTPETALELEAVLGIPAAVWTNLQSAYDRFRAREAHTEGLRDQIEFLKEVPVREMVKLAWIEPSSDKIEQLRSVFRFFAVSSLKAWREKYEQPVAAFRASDKGKIGARAAWYRKAELELDRIAAGYPEYKPAVFKEALQKIRSFTRERTDVGFRHAVASCKSAGVALLVVRELPGAGVSGATLWKNKTPGIALTLRYKSDDQFWFSFFHESGHVLLHRGKMFLEVASKTRSVAEREADKFAADQFIPAHDLARLKATSRFSETAVEGFAAELGICPGIVVGRLQHDKVIPPHQLNGLKRKLRWHEE